MDQIVRLHGILKTIISDRGTQFVARFWEQLHECLSVFQTGNLLRGVPEVDECGLAKIGNSKEETCGTQFRQVRAARCVIPYVLYAA
jgi:hypothetical protein